MNIQQESLGNSQVQLTIEVEPERLRAARQQTLRTLSKQIQVPGFRKGKAPAHLVERHANPAYVVEETYNTLLPVLLDEAVKQTGIQPYSYDDMEMDVLSQEPFTLRLIVPVMPTVTLGDASELVVEPIYPEMDENEVEATLQQLREKQALWHPIEEAAAEGDRVTFDFSVADDEGNMVVEPERSERILSLTTYDDDMDLEERALAVEADEIVRALIGMQPGESKRFTLDYPAEYPEPTLAGRALQATIFLEEAKRKELPELDDEFAHAASGDLETLEALRQRLAESLEAQARDQALSASLERVLDALIDESTLEYPEAMVRYEVRAQLDRLVAPLAAYGIDRARYLQIMNKTLEEMEEELRDEAELRLRRSLILTEYVRTQNLEITPEELEQEITMLLRGAPADERESLRQGLLEDREALEGVQSRLITRKGLYQLYAVATGEESPPLFMSEGETEELPSGDTPKPLPSGAIDYPEYQDWTSEGGTPAEGDVTPTASGPTQEEVEAILGDEEGAPALPPIPYPEYQAWTSEGGTPAEGDVTPTVRPRSEEELAEAGLQRRDGELVPLPSDPVPYPEYQDWTSEGGTPAEGDVTPSASGPTQDDIDAIEERH